MNFTRQLFYSFKDDLSKPTPVILILDELQKVSCGRLSLQQLKFNRIYNYLLVGRQLRN